MVGEGRKVLIVHVPYEYPGGEDVYFETLAQAYRKLGFAPILYPANRRSQKNPLAQAAASLAIGAQVPPDFDVIWRDAKPDFIHLNNVFPSLGPRFLRWLIVSRVPTLMTIHNHRFYCTNGLALRNGKICKDCLHAKIPWRPMLHNCNSSRVKTAYHSAAIYQIQTQNLYQRAITRFIAPSPYISSELVSYGISEDQIDIIPHPVETSEGQSAPALPILYDVFYAGRLSNEKGIQGLLRTIELLPDLKFCIAGDGPEKAKVIEAEHKFGNLQFLGPVERSKIPSLIVQARASIMPSLCNESFGLFALESFYQGRYCVVPHLDANRWLTSGDLLGLPADMAQPSEMAQAIRDALKRGLVSGDKLGRIRTALGYEKFCLKLSESVKIILK